MFQEESSEQIPISLPFLSEKLQKIWSVFFTNESFPRYPWQAQ